MTDLKPPPMCEPQGFFQLLLDLAQTGHIVPEGVTGEAMTQIRAALAAHAAPGVTPVDSFRAAKWLDPECYEAGCCQSLKFATRQAMFAAAPTAAQPVAPPATSIPKERLALNVQHKDCHKAADAFWEYWNANGETHKRGYYESTWGAINRALRTVGVIEHHYAAQANTQGEA